MPSTEYSYGSSKQCQWGRKVEDDLDGTVAWALIFH